MVTLYATMSNLKVTVVEAREARIIEGEAIVVEETISLRQEAEIAVIRGVLVTQVIEGEVVIVKITNVKALTKIKITPQGIHLNSKLTMIILMVETRVRGKVGAEEPEDQEVEPVAEGSKTREVELTTREVRLTRSMLEISSDIINYI